MPNTYVDYTGDNTTTSFAFPFPYLDDTHVVVQLDTVALAGGKFVDQTVTTHYTIQTSPSAAIIFVTAPATGDRIRIKRDSASDIALVDFENGSVLTEVELDRAYLHNLYLSEEIEEGSGKNVMTKDPVDGHYDADLAKIKNLADPTNPQDAVTKNYADTTFVDVAGDTMTGNLDMGSNKVTSSAVPGAGNDLTNKTYVDGQDALQVTKAGDNMTGDLAMGGNMVSGLGAPISSDHSARKGYVDQQDLLQVTKAGDSMSGNLQMGVNKVTSTAVPSVGNDLTNKTYVDSVDVLKVNKSGDTMSGTLDMGTNKIANVLDPLNAQEAATKKYVDDTITTSFATGTPPPANQIGTNTITDSAITTEKINNSSITTEKINNSSITTEKINDGAITTNKINDDAITADKLANTAVTPGSYTATNLTVDAQGRITAAANGSASPSAADVKTLYESNANTNEYDDAEQTKLAGIAAGATANDTDSNLKNRANHTGTQLAATISDLSSAIAEATFPSDDIWYASAGTSSGSNLLVTQTSTGNILKGEIDAALNPYGNIIIGKTAGRSLTSTGTAQIGGNIAIGERALDDIFHTIPADNGGGGAVAIGTNSMCGYTGIRSIGIGFGAGRVSQTALNPYNNCSQIGNEAVATGDNQVVLGDSSITALKCNVQTITSLSDERTKENIKDSNLGLEFINELKTKTFNKKNPADWEGDILEEQYKNKESEDYIRPKNNPTTYTGLIAQEVKGVLDKLNISEWDGWNEEPNGVQRLGYGALVMPLIKAVQELSAQVEDLKSKI